LTTATVRRGPQREKAQRGSQAKAQSLRPADGGCVPKVCACRTERRMDIRQHQPSSSRNLCAFAPLRSFGRRHESDVGRPSSSPR
jgi:hypothetical protein